MLNEILYGFFVIILLAISIYLFYLYIKSYFKIKELKKELNNQDLDYHLRKIESSGYDYTIKAKKNDKLSSPKKSNSKKDNKLNSAKSGKKKKSKTFKDLIPKQK